MPDENAKTPATSSEPVFEPISELVRAILQPIANAPPAGYNVRNDDAFSDLKREIEKRGNDDASSDPKKEVGKRGGINYETVITSSRRLLTENSKDLLVAAYLCVGLFQPELEHREKAQAEVRRLNEEIDKLGISEKNKNPEKEKKLDLLQQELAKTQARLVQHYRFSGLAEGLQIVHGLLLRFGDEVFPPDAKFRLKAVNWLASKIREPLPLYKPLTEHRAALNQVAAVLLPLNAFLEKNFEAEYPTYYSIEKTITQCLEKLSAEEKEKSSKEKETPSKENPETPPETVTPNGNGKKNGEAFVIASAKEAEEQLSKAALFLKGQNGKDPLPYRLLRLQLWEAITESPAIEKNNITRLPPPYRHADLRKEIDAEIKASNWELVIKRCEEEFGEARFWLDLQRFIGHAANAAKNGFEAVAEAVRWETAYLLQRFPNLTDLCFKDGTPFADAETKRWVQNSVKPMNGSVAAAVDGQKPADAPLPVGDEIAAEFAAAQKILSESRDVGKALAHLQAGMAADFSHKGRFRRRLHMAMLCFEQSNFKIALPLLEELDREIEKHALQEWEPEWCLQVWTPLKKCYEELLRLQQNQNHQAYHDGASRTFEKICRIDVRRAFDV